MVDTRIDIHYVCQRCLQPIKLDSSFNNPGEHVLAELNLPICSNPEVDLKSQAASVDHFIPANRFCDSGPNDFTFIDNKKGDNNNFSHRMKVTASLFDIVSGNTEIDHPLCEECTDNMFDILGHQLRTTEEECSDYSKFLKKLENENHEEGIDVLKNELDNLHAEEERLKRELEALQEEETAMEMDIREQEKEKERLEKDENKYWREYSKHRRDFLLTEDELMSLENQLNYSKKQLDRISKINVFNATFHIWHHGHFGTINNFRLGRLPSAPVDWNEINAAWGQTALLLNSLARKMNFTFDKYRLVPYGNHSYIEVLADHKELPLYGSGGIKFLWDTKFDAAMVAFLDCLQQFKEQVEKTESGFFCLPYKMENGKIEDTATSSSYSIKIQLNSEEQWTKALKFLLTNLKWGLAWTSTMCKDDYK